MSWKEHSILPNELHISDEDLQLIWNMCPTEYDTITLFGKTHNVPRFHTTFGIDYRFSGKDHKAIPIPSLFNKYLQYFSSKYNCQYNMILVNWYVNGEHYIGMHSDDERQIKNDTPIITLSFGDSRTFKIQHKNSKEMEKYLLNSNEYFVMGGTFQKEYKHGIPKEKNKTKRVSLTFRCFQ